MYRSSCCIATALVVSSYPTIDVETISKGLKDGQFEACCRSKLIQSHSLTLIHNTHTHTLSFIRTNTLYHFHNVLHLHSACPDLRLRDPGVPCQPDCPARQVRLRSRLLDLRCRLDLCSQPHNGKSTAIQLHLPHEQNPDAGQFFVSVNFCSTGSESNGRDRFFGRDNRRCLAMAWPSWTWLISPRPSSLRFLSDSHSLSHRCYSPSMGSSPTFISSPFVTCWPFRMLARSFTYLQSVLALPSCAIVVDVWGQT